MNEILYAPPAKKARIEIIPLIDVIFFLLATFVLFTLSLNRLASLDTKMPVGGPPGIEDSTVYVQASSAGMVYWKEGSSGTPETITLAELSPRLARYKRNTATPRVFVRGDNQANFGAAVAILDEVRKAGIEQVSVETHVSPSGN